MALNPYEDLKGFAVNRPPLILFVICLGLFAIVLMTLAFYVSDEEITIKNPDVTQDWNVFLENFADIEFCIVDDQNETLSTVVAPTKELSKGSDVSTLPTTQELQPDLKNYSVSMLLTVSPTKAFINMSHNLTLLSASITGAHLGLRGAAGEEMINITMHLPYEWNTTKCHRTGCEPFNIYTCVYFQATSFMFPDSRSPDVCENVNDTLTGVEYHVRMMSQGPKNVFTSYYCRARPMIKAHHKLDPRLTVWLSMHDRSVINLHLMHTSYFLFVMVVMILCYALFRGRSLSAAYVDKSNRLASSASI